MAKQRLHTSFLLPLKTQYDTVDCILIVEVEGSKVPNLEVIGSAFDTARETFMAAIKEAHQPKPTPPIEEPQPVEPRMVS